MPAAFTRSHYRSPRRSPGANLNETSCTRFLPVVARALILFLSTLTHPLARSIINSTPYTLAFPPVVDALGISRTHVAEVGDSHRPLVAHCRASRDPLVDPNANFAADAVIDIRLPDGWRSVFREPARSSESTPSFVWSPLASPSHRPTRRLRQRASWIRRPAPASERSSRQARSRRSSPIGEPSGSHRLTSLRECA